MKAINSLNINQEIIENIIDKGNKGLTKIKTKLKKNKKKTDESNIDEVITFNHTYLKYRIFEEGLENEKITETPFLINQELLIKSI